MKKIALFDLDHTLIPFDSDHAWGEFTTRIGWTDAADFTRTNNAFYADYQRGELDINAYIRFTTQAARKKGPELSYEAQMRFMREVVQPRIAPAALSLLKQHRDACEQLILITATNEFVTRPISHALGISELIAVELAVDDRGWITGEIKGTPSYREGKVTRTAQWLAQRGLAWDDVECTFYSDSINDLPLLEKVQHPVATNPDAPLRAIAIARGWRILDLFQDIQ
jgi:HAD superfamily hydrolase (TIGR01490 family)